MHRHRVLSTPVLTIAVVVVATGTAWAALAGANQPLGEHTVGRQGDGSVLTAENKYVTPAGDTIEQTGQPMDLEVSPDGHTAVTLTKSGQGLFTVVDLQQKKVVQQYTPPAGVGSGTIGVGGILYSADGKTLWATQTRDLLKFSVAADGTLSSPTVIALPTAGTAGPFRPVRPVHPRYLFPPT